MHLSFPCRLCSTNEPIFICLFAVVIIKVAKEDDERIKRAHATRMRLLAVIQGQYLINAWAKAKAEHDANEGEKCEA